MNWICKHFKELNLSELYEMGRLRQEVFVVEQDCPYIDFDGKDYDCYHLMSFEATTMQAYARLVPVSISYPKACSIGRVITSPKLRGKGAGKLLMQKAIEQCKQYWPNTNIRISAQTYLLTFYQGFGFIETEKRYLEDGIPHTEMLLTETNTTT